jgi:hypothetical protein
MSTHIAELVRPGVLVHYCRAETGFPKGRRLFEVNIMVYAPMSVSYLIFLKLLGRGDQEEDGLLALLLLDHEREYERCRLARPRARN